MGADLIGVVLTIDERKEPNWEAAHKWAESLSEDEVFGNEITDAFEQYAPFEEDFGIGLDPEEMKADKEWDFAGERRKAILSSIETAKEIYEGGWRNTMDFYVRGARVWILAETSWGDSPEGFDDMWFFIMNGAAEAAGFDGE